MADWKDFTVILCTLLIVIGALALGVAAQSFTVVQGKVLEKGEEKGFRQGTSYSIHTVSILIEDDDRVYRIERGTVVKYSISESDAERIEVGSNVKLLVSSYQSAAKAIGIEGSRPP